MIRLRFFRWGSLIFGALAARCSPAPSDLEAVWTEGMRPPPDLATPAGFAISPSEAYSVAWDSRALSWKHIWHIYADSRFYYVHDIFLGDSPRRVFVQGLRIDGRIGGIANRSMDAPERKTKHPAVCTIADGVNTEKCASSR